MQNKKDKQKEIINEANEFITETRTKKLIEYGFTSKQGRKYREAIRNRDRKALEALCLCGHTGKCPVCDILRWEDRVNKYPKKDIKPTKIHDRTPAPTAQSKFLNQKHEEYHDMKSEWLDIVEQKDIDT